MLRCRARVCAGGTPTGLRLFMHREDRLHRRFPRRKHVVFQVRGAGLTGAYLCQIDNTTSYSAGAVTPAQCKVFLGILMMAQASRQRVEFAFNDTLTCGTHPTWAPLTGTTVLSSWPTERPAAA
jgi:hypothetical protein